MLVKSLAQFFLFLTPQSPTALQTRNRSSSATGAAADTEKTERQAQRAQAAARLMAAQSAAGLMPSKSGGGKVKRKGGGAATAAAAAAAGGGGDGSRPHKKALKPEGTGLLLAPGTQLLPAEAASATGPLGLPPVDDLGP